MEVRSKLDNRAIQLMWPLSFRSEPTFCDKNILEKVNNPNPKPWVSFGIRLAITTLLELCRGPAKKVPATTNTIYALGFLLMEIILILYFSILIAIGVVASKNVNNISDYYVGGKKLF